MAGEIAEIARDLRGDFRSLDPTQPRVVLVEAGDRVLAAFPPALSAKAQRSARLGVSILLEHTAVELDARSVTVKYGDHASRRISCRTVIWAAGVVASSLAGVLAERAGLEVDRAGRVEVLEDLSRPGHPNVLAIGDMIRVRQPGRLLDHASRGLGRGAGMTVGDVLGEIDPQRELVADGEVITIISAARGDHRMSGVLIETYDAIGRVERATLLLRPLSALLEAITAMRTTLEQSPLPSTLADCTG